MGSTYSPPRPKSPLLSNRNIKIVVLAVACLIGGIILVDYIVLKSRAIVSTTLEKPAAPPPSAQVLAPQPAFESTPAAPDHTAPEASVPVVSDPPPAPPAPVPHSEAVNTTSVTPTPAPPAVTAPATAVATTAPAQPLVRPVPVADESDGVTDQAINDAIQAGVTHLLKKFESGRPEDEPGHMVGGVHTLVTLALLHAGEATFDERLSLSNDFMRGMLESIKQYPFDLHYETYSHALRAAALGLRNRKEDREVLEADLQWLLKASVAGGYSYTMPPDTMTPEQHGPDYSNSQYGALGVWAASDAGLNVPESYWQAVENFWVNGASPAGGWGYHPRSAQPSLAMTTAGLTTLFVARDHLNEQRTMLKPGEDPFPEVISSALKWLSTGDNSIADLGPFPGYTLYGLERAGLATGFKMFGTHDWYREHAARVLKEQQEDGSWGNNVETAFRILFLSRGRHPILMNKLRFDGPWSNRPRDIMRLTRFVFSSIERPLNWQVVNLSDPWETWMDAPVIYLASHEPPELTDEHVEKLRQFTMAGGLLFTHADADSRKFNDFARQLAARLYPQLPYGPLADDHVIYSAMYQPKMKVPLEGVSNGVRLLMVHSPTDLASKWQHRDARTAAPHFEIGANVFVYATGKHPLRNRLDTPVIPEVKAAPIAMVNVARVKHDGVWDPEPAAWPRFARWFQTQTSIRLIPKELAPASLARQTTPVAHLTSAAAIAMPDDQLEALRRYVKGGGVLLIDACGGSPDAVKSLREGIAARLFPDIPAAPLAADHPLLAGTGEGMVELDRPQLRVFAVERLTQETPQMQVVEAGEGIAIFSPLDLTSGLLGTTTWGIIGYDPAYAQAFMKNLVLWATLGRGQPLELPDIPPAAAPAQ